MCVIITTPSQNYRPTLKQLTLCEEMNPHGSGVAWVAKGKVEYRKNLTVKEIRKLLKKVVGPAIVHFRIASVGGVNPELCHPFPVTVAPAALRQHGTAKKVLFHNGTWSAYTRAIEKLGLSFPEGEPVSDTRVAASLVARFGLDVLAKNSAGNRWATLTPKGIKRAGEWTRFGGCYFSNTFWRPEPPQWRPWKQADWWKSYGGEDDDR